MTRLDAHVLDRLDSRVRVPGYVRGDASVGVVHFGVGAFHRAHQAMYLDSCLAAGESTWGICGAGVLPADRAIRDVLVDQDGLYTLLTVDPAGATDVRVVGSILTHLHAPDDPQAVLDRLTDPSTRIVSLTITEGGYGINDATRAFEPNGATLADLDSADPPISVLGFLVSALAARRAAGTAPFTVMSCDNVQGNGDVAKAAVTAFAACRDPGLAVWIAEHVAFPNSMVDRITPASTDDTRAAVAAFGIDDRWPVRSESFTQWVLEDRFSAGRPALEQVGVQMVDDVMPYELMKLRLLNASHQVMSYLGLLAGATYVHEVCRDPLFVRFLLDYMHEEAVPTLQPVPGIDLDVYCDQLIARFTSEAIRDTLARQVVDGSDRIPKFLLPVIAEQLRNGRGITRCALVLAAWSLFLAGEADLGPSDRRLADLRAAVAAEQETPGAFLAYRPVFGDLGSNPALQSAFIASRIALRRLGARGAMSALTEQGTR